MKNNAKCNLPGCVMTRTGGIHDGESFASRWSHLEIEMRRIVGVRFEGVVLGEYKFRAFGGSNK
jgi:hypothetical protein